MFSTSAPAAPAVVVHGLEQACAALRSGLPVTLLSAHGAACYGGCAWWRALVAAAQAETGNNCRDILDCADAPGYALAALRIGQTALVLDPTCRGFPAVVAIAETLGAQILSERPRCLDLADRGAIRRLAAWLTPPPA